MESEPKRGLPTPCELSEACLALSGLLVSITCAASSALDPSPLAQSLVNVSTALLNTLVSVGPTSSQPEPAKHDEAPKQPPRPPGR